MEDLQIETLRKLGSGMFLNLLQVISALLVTYGAVSKDTAEVLVPQIAPILFGFLMSAVTLYFQYRRAKYNAALPKAALEAHPDTPMSVLKAEVKSKL